jgi:sugar phosphate isomerase/epimerase
MENKHQTQQTHTHAPSRRSFLAAAASAACLSGLSTPGLAADSPSRKSGSLLKLSLAAYSFNRLLPRRGTPEQVAAAKMKLEDFIDFCAEQNLAATELTGYYFPKEITTEYLLSLKARTHRLGLSISGTAIGNDFCLPEGEARQAQLSECREWIDYAAIMGAPAIRIFAGKVPRGDSEEAAIERCAAGINECLQYAAKRGVFLALENHGGITATPDQMLKIIAAVDDSPWFGVNFDSGNFRTDDPYRDLARIAPYAVNAQIKTAVTIDGQKQPADLKRIIDILKAADYRGYVALEYEEREDPFTNIPRHLAELTELIHG